MKIQRKRHWLVVCSTFLSIMFFSTVVFATVGQSPFNNVFDGKGGTQETTRMKIQDRTDVALDVTGYSAQGSSSVTFNAYGYGFDSERVTVNSKCSRTLDYIGYRLPEPNETVTLRIAASSGVLGVGGYWIP